MRRWSAAEGATVRKKEVCGSRSSRTSAVAGQLSESVRAVWRSRSTEALETDSYLEKHFLGVADEHVVWQLADKGEGLFDANVVDCSLVLSRSWVGHLRGAVAGLHSGRRGSHGSLLLEVLLSFLFAQLDGVVFSLSFGRLAKISRVESFLLALLSNFVSSLGFLLLLRWLIRSSKLELRRSCVA